LYRLATKTLGSFAADSEAGSNDETFALVVDQKEFLAEHLLKWSSQFAEAINSAKADPLYLSAARFADYFNRSI
jgi:TorA maturation chaperone TorD